LKTGGYLILTTVNKFVFERREDVAPIAPGQIRQWLNTKDVKLLLRPLFCLQRVMTVMPEGHKGTLRLINSHKLNALMQLFFSPATLTRLKEMAGLGQTIVVLARK
jgi:hypothetical protein